MGDQIPNKKKRYRRDTGKRHLEMKENLFLYPSDCGVGGASMYVADNVRYRKTTSSKDDEGEWPDLVMT